MKWKSIENKSITSFQSEDLTLVLSFHIFQHFIKYSRRICISGAHSVAPSPLFKCEVLMVPRKHATKTHTLIYVRCMISTPQPHQLFSQFSWWWRVLETALFIINHIHLTYSLRKRGYDNGREREYMRCFQNIIDKCLDLTLMLWMYLANHVGWRWTFRIVVGKGGDPLHYWQCLVQYFFFVGRFLLVLETRPSGGTCCCFTLVLMLYACISYTRNFFLKLDKGKLKSARVQGLGLRTTPHTDTWFSQFISNHLSPQDPAKALFSGGGHSTILNFFSKRTRNPYFFWLLELPWNGARPKKDNIACIILTCYRIPFSSCITICC